MSYDFNADKHHRHSIRLKGYDYSQAGGYFITINTQNREHLFGEIIDYKMILNDAGRMVETVWNEIPIFYHGIEIDVFQIMPDHFHGIIFITNNDDDVRAGPRASPDEPSEIPEQPQGVANTLSLPDMVHRFKTMTTKRYTDSVKQNDWPPFNARLWQRNYWEHIIRDARELDIKRNYIIENPARWQNNQNNS